MYRSIVSIGRLSRNGRGHAAFRVGAKDTAKELRFARPFLNTSILQSTALLDQIVGRENRVLHTFNTPDENLQQPAFKVQVDGSPPPFSKLLAANRGEISCRINRAASELGITTAGIYSYEGKEDIDTVVRTRVGRSTSQ
jgi:Biotin carboxylase, N-terminal domain